MVILENIGIDKAILQNIDIDKISNRFKFGISNRATKRPIGASMINVFNMKKVSHWNPDMRVPKFLLHAPKNWILGPKTAKFGPKLAFWAKYRHFCPIWSKAWPKNDANKLSLWFSVMLVPKLLLTPIKIRIFGPKMAKFGPKSSFLVILGQILAFLAHVVQCPTKIQCEQSA